MQLTIEKLVYGGDGLARLTEPNGSLTGDSQSDAVKGRLLRGKAVFVPFVMPGEQVEAAPVEEKRGFVRAALAEVLVSSPERVAPLCPYFQRCGGCHYQHTSYDSQLAIKRQILAETLERTAKIRWPGEIHVHRSQPWEYRNRTRMKVATSPFALGYYRHSSHDLLPIENCPISSPLINRAIDVLWEIGRIGGRAEYSLFEIELFANHDDTKLMLELYVRDGAPSQKWESLVAELCKRLPVAAVAVFSSEAGQARRGPISDQQLKTKLEFLFQPESFIYTVAADSGEISYQVSAGAFFQSNGLLISKLVDIICADNSGEMAWDLYAGVGLFTVPLAKAFGRVEAVEATPASFADLEKNVLPNVRAHRMTTTAYLESAARAQKRRSPDLVVVDPPRAGLGVGSARKLAAIAPARLMYVSCDPATLARDLAVFLESGYAMKQVHLVDLFPQTYHIETVVQLDRKRSL